MEHDVFISYSHIDQSIADAICNRLEGDGVRCWYAPRNIRPGHEWAEEIIYAIEKSKIMVLVFTGASNDSTQVRREVSKAVSAGVTIIPFKCTLEEPTGSMQYYLSTVHWLDAMNAELEASISMLLAECKSIIGVSGTDNDNKAVQTPVISSQVTDTSKVNVNTSQKDTSKSKLNKVMIPVVAAVVALIAIIYAVSAKQNGNKSTGESSSSTSSSQSLSNSSSSSSQVKPVVDGEYYDDENNDSDGAEFYLYDVSSVYSDVYDKGVILNKYFGEDTDVIEIPAVVDGWPVTGLGEKCFEGYTNIQKVILPDTLEFIGYRAFYGCGKLSDLALPDSLLYTNGWALAHTAITEFIAPPNFRSLGYGTFYSCGSLKKVVLTEACKSLGSDTFCYLGENCTITVPNKDVTVDIKAFREDDDVIIIAPAGSYLETYAKAMKLTFQAMD